MKKQKINPHLFQVPKVKIVKGRMEYVIDRCRGKRVLHLGCVDEGLTIERIKSGELMHLKLLKVAKELCGVDISKKGLEIFRKEGIDNLILGDVEHLDSIKELRNKKFDIILASEIIEHLNNPGLFLQSAKILFLPNTKMILTTPNAFRFTQLKYSFKGYEFVHPDHNYWFSWKTLSTLLNKNGYVIDEVLVYDFKDFKQSILKKITKKIFVKKTKEKETPKSNSNNHTKEKNILIGSYLKVIISILVRRFLYRKNPFWSDGLIFVVRPK